MGIYLDVKREHCGVTGSIHGLEEQESLATLPVKKRVGDDLAVSVQRFGGQRSDWIARFKIENSKSLDSARSPSPRMLAWHPTSRARRQTGIEASYRVSLNPSRETASAIDEQVSQNRKNERVQYRLFFNATEE
jgi:hypothetical protein